MWWKLGLAFVGGAVVGGVSIGIIDYKQYNKTMDEAERYMTILVTELNKLKLQAEELEKRVMEEQNAQQ